MLNKIFADFNNADAKGRVRLNTNGSCDDIRNNNIQLFEGAGVLLDDQDGLVAPAILEYSNEENIWVALIDWKKLESCNE